MPGTLPDGEPVPASGTLPGSARAGLGERPFGLYVHVPFCATRCGYCDFNTYTSDELGPGANRAEYAGTAIVELRRAAEVLGPDLPTVSTVFVGGGTPTLLPADDLAAVLAAVAAPVDHVSAYALIVEEGTRLARRISRGELPMPDDDVLADRYEQADATLRDAGFEWYEVSNWATSDAARCRHNELYWANANWWGAGPGAHSHVGGLRWWNVKHPAAYAARLAAGESPARDAELLDDDDRALEAIMLGLRLR